jgi:hypothetical protein
MPMRCSLATPELWGLTIELPKDVSHFAFKYVATDSSGVLWIEPGAPRVIDIHKASRERELRGGGDIEQEDAFDNGLQSSRDTYLFLK